jgi:hypothetical protein
VNIIDATRNINKTYKYYNNNKNVNSGLARYRIRKTNSPTQNIPDNYQSKINTETKRSTSPSPDREERRDLRVEEEGRTVLD